MQDSNVIRDILAAVASSEMMRTAGYGAAGGLVSAIAVKEKPSAMLRQVALGAMISAGAGTVVADVLARFGIVSDPNFAAGASVGGMSFLAGVFLPAIFEVILRRIRSGVLLGEDQKDGG